MLPHHYVESELVRFEKMSEDQISFFERYYQYLANEREKVLENIKDALVSNIIRDYSVIDYSRIVGGKYLKSPLSSKGSFLVPPGGRFNFDQSISYQGYFPALYVSDSYETSYCEKFGDLVGFKTKDGLTANDLSLKPKIDSFSHFKLKIQLDQVLDLRKEKVFKEFFEEIKHIGIPKELSAEAKKLKLSSLSVIGSFENLRDAIFAHDYGEYVSWINQHSPSQWFGHYVRLSNIQGIVYPSVKNNSGVNIAIFLEQFEGTNSFVELSDDADIDENQKRVDKNNFNDFI